MKKIVTIILLGAGLICVANAQQADRLISESVTKHERTYSTTPKPNRGLLARKLHRLEQLTAFYPKLRDTQNAAPRVVLGTELIQNGSFESGPAADAFGFSAISTPWDWFSEGASSTDNPRYNKSAHTGTWAVYFDFGESHDQLAQRVTIPSGSTVTLSFWLKIGTSFGGPSDVFGVNFCDLSGAPLPGFVKNFHDSDSPGYVYVHYSYDVSAFAGQTVYLLFWSRNTDDTIFMLDDVSLIANAGAGPTPTPTPTPTPQVTATRTPTPTPTPTAPPSGTSGSRVFYSSGTAHAAGSNGAFWMTDMTFANGTVSDLTVKLFLNNATSGERFSFLLPMGQSRTITDIIQFMGLQDGAYVLRTEATCPVYAPTCSTELFSVTARTYSQGYGGWFGTALPSIPAYVGSKTIAFQEMSNSRKALYVFGIPTSVTTFDKTGVPIAYVDLGLFSAGQLMRLPLSETVSYVKVSVTANSFCYGTQVDNATQSQVIIY